MENTLIALVLLAELAAMCSCRRQLGWATAAGMTGLYIIIAQITAWMVLHDIIDHEMLQVYGGTDRDADLLRAIICAAGLFAGVWALSLPGRDSEASRPSPCSTNQCPVAVGVVCAIIWSGLLVTSAVSLEWATLWSTPHYLNLTDPTAMTHGALAGLAIGALPVAGATSAAVAAAIFASSRPIHGLACILTLQGALTMIWLLAAHSRAAALIPLAFAFISMLSPVPLAGRRRAGYWRIGASLVLVIVTLGGALSARNLGDHGLASLAALPAQLADTSAWAPALATNLTEGIFAVAAGLGEWLRSPGASVHLFPSDYIWLSFSPLPSALDGFASILHAQVRLHAYAPMPGYVELAWFGPWSQLSFVVLAALGFRLASRAKNHSHLSGGAAAVLLAGCLYLMAAYPLRTALKLLWLSLGISCCTILAASLHSPLRAAPPIRRPEFAS